MTDYYTHGCIGIHNLELDQIEKLETLLRLADKLEDNYLPHPNEFKLRGSLQAQRKALAFVTLYDGLTYEDIDWGFVGSSGMVLHLNLDNLQVAGTVSDALFFGYRYVVAPNQIYRDIELSSHDEAQDLAYFLINVYRLIMYRWYLEQAAGDLKLMRAVFDYVEANEYEEERMQYSVDTEGSIYIYNTGGFDAKYGKNICQLVIELLDLPGQLAFQWSETSSKTIPYHHGGGVCVVNKDRYVFLETDSLMHMSPEVLNRIYSEEENENQGS